MMNRCKGGVGKGAWFGLLEIRGAEEVAFADADDEHCFYIDAYRDGP